ncbi:hypothetical protein B0H14DRAFT_3476783 [Mycena olivaceomarginata]|nr:hypothetical protein B0H14DRAFT_3476783 [Mycena olivaceomarginata]
MACGRPALDPDISPDSSPPSSPSSLSDSVASHQSSATSSAPFSLQHAPILSPPPSPHENQAKLTKDNLAFLASFRPGPGSMSPQRLKQQFERVLGPHAVLTGPSSQPTAQKQVRPGRRVRAEGKPPAGVERPQNPQTLPRALCTRSGELSHEAAPSPRALVHPQSRPVGESFDGTMYAVSSQNRIFKDRDRAVAVFKNTPAADLLFTCDEREIFDFLAADVRDMKI